MLGVPVGSPRFCAEYVQGKLPVFMRRLAAIAQVDPGDGQQAMLRHCASAWLVHYARLVPPECLSALSRFDRALERLVCHSLDAPAECADTLSTTRSLINLPMRWGGHGYHILHEVAGMSPPQLAERPTPSVDDVLSVIDPAASTESAGEYDLWD